MSDRNRLADVEPEDDDLTHAPRIKLPGDDVDLASLIPDPSYVPPNAGALYGVEIAPWESSEERLEAEAEERDLSYEQAMKGPPSTQRHHRPRGSGGGGNSGGGRAKEAKPSKAPPKSKDDEADREPPVPCYAFLTIGEREHFEGQPGLMLFEARELVREILCEQWRQDAPRSADVRARAKRTELYGLTQHEVDVLQDHTPALSNRLAARARARNGDRIKLREAQAS